MLKKRIITAIVLIVFLLFGIFSLTPLTFFLLLGSVVLIGAWEWMALIGVVDLRWRSMLVAIVMLLGLLLFVVLPPDYITVLLLISTVWWLSNFRCIQLSYHLPSFNVSRWYAEGVVGGGVLLPAWLAMVVLQSVGERGPIFLVFLMVLIWVADSSAFFVGRKWGSTKLAPHISPGKTWIGASAALVASAMLGIVGASVMSLSGFYTVLFITLCIVTVAFSILGDLFESLYKRRAGVKDSGSLLPGHGGVLDRIDSLTAAAPVFVSGFLMMDLA